MKRFAMLCVVALAAACAPAPVAVAPGPAVEIKPAGCAASRDADFEGEAAERLGAYLAWLAQTHGAAVGLTPQDVSLAIAHGRPKPGPTGVQAGDVSCGWWGRGPYRITLFRDALSGRARRVAYHTLAHEFHHIVQIRRDDLAGCEAKGSAQPYEREAERFARSVVPACK